MAFFHLSLYFMEKVWYNTTVTYTLKNYYNLIYAIDNWLNKDKISVWE